MNGSTDNTLSMLTAWQAEHPGQISIYALDGNYGIARARNAHFQFCIGQDCMRLDDKIQVESPHWSTIVRRQAYNHHALVAFTDPDTEGLWYDQRALKADIIEYPMWMCGASLFIPGEVSAQLGAWDEFSWPDGSPLLYGWEDMSLFIRAAQIGWPFRYTMSAKATFLSRASAETRARAMEFEPYYLARKAEYENGERDLFIDIAQTEGYALGRQVPVSGLVSVGAAMELAYP